MADQEASRLAESFLPKMPTEPIPVLSSVLPVEAVSPALREALDARVQDKLEWMALESHILQALRPEVERLTTQLVQSSLREVWLQRSQVKF